ncbi:hypothetical protein FACS1894103_3690 [Campylobacterota bacterium]|nr:hypothetical protein FACS1894103_3690 [Campylobacterota bacterium]
MSDTENAELKPLLEKVSNWAWDNAPALLAITIAVALPSIVGFVGGIALYAFLNYYQTRSGTRADSNN